MKTKLKLKKISNTGADFDNHMSIQLWHTDDQVKIAEQTLNDLIKSWNMHDELIEQHKINVKFFSSLIIMLSSEKDNEDLVDELKTKLKITQELIQKDKETN